MQNMSRKATRLTHLRKGNVSACYKGKGQPPALRELTKDQDSVTCRRCIAIIDKRFETECLGDVNALI